MRVHDSQAYRITTCDIIHSAAIDVIFFSLFKKIIFISNAFGHSVIYLFAAVSGCCCTFISLHNFCVLVAGYSVCSED